MSILTFYLQTRSLLLLLQLLLLVTVHAKVAVLHASGVPTLYLGSQPKNKGLADIQYHPQLYLVPRHSRFVTFHKLTLQTQNHLLSPIKGFFLCKCHEMTFQKYMYLLYMFVCTCVTICHLRDVESEDNFLLSVSKNIFNLGDLLEGEMGYIGLYFIVHMYEIL